MKPPKPEEIQKEFEEFVHQRFGDKIQVVSSEVPFAESQSKAKKKPETISSKTDNRSNTNEDYLAFDYKPKDIKKYLDKYVIGQEEAKKAISIALCDHYNQVRVHKKSPDSTKDDNYNKQNLLILGTTGVGKTYMIRQAAKLIGVPFVKADATRFSETGYMGANVDDLIRDLSNQANNDLSKAQYGIIYLDEVDKLANQGSQSSGRDVSGRGVQLGLLKLMEETDVDLRAGNDPASQIQAFMELQRKGRVDKQVINTKYILFIASGAFNGLEKIIEKRLHKNTIGFQSVSNEPIEEKNQFSHASTQDFIQFGLEPEFIGRLPVRVACHELDEKVLYDILNSSEGSILKQYKMSFKAHGIEASFESDAIWEIARRASKEKTGARGLFTICETFLRDFKFELPSTSIKSFSITKDLILNPKEHLQKLLATQEKKFSPELVESLKSFEKDFSELYKMSLTFESHAMELIDQKRKLEKKSAHDLCQNILSSYGHGLKLIQNNTGQDNFLITAEIIKNPEQELEKMVKESYKNSRKTKESQV